MPSVQPVRCKATNSHVFGWHPCVLPEGHGGDHQWETDLDIWTRRNAVQPADGGADATEAPPARLLKTEGEPPVPPETPARGEPRKANHHGHAYALNGLTGENIICGCGDFVLADDLVCGNCHAASPSPEPVPAAGLNAAIEYHEEKARDLDQRAERLRREEQRFTLAAAREEMAGWHRKCAADLRALTPAAGGRG